MKELQMTKKKKSLTQFYNDEIYAKTKNTRRYMDLKLAQVHMMPGIMKPMLLSIHLCRRICH